jgi:hypothetical protein
VHRDFLITLYMYQLFFAHRVFKGPTEKAFSAYFVSIELGNCSRYVGWTAGWTSEESSFDFRKVTKYSVFGKSLCT